MVGLRLLGINMIDKRLRQAFPSASYDAVFGGLSIILLGDFSQLHPVFDKPLYHNAEGGLSEMEAFGLVAYCLAATPVGHLEKEEFLRDQPYPVQMLRSIQKKQI